MTFLAFIGRSQFYGRTAPFVVGVGSTLLSYCRAPFKTAMVAIGIRRINLCPVPLHAHARAPLRPPAAARDFFNELPRSFTAAVRAPSAAELHSTCKTASCTVRFAVTAGNFGLAPCLCRCPRL
jgi:hypothetical protein